LSFAAKAIEFFEQLKPPGRLPPGVQSLYPYKDPAVQAVIRAFFNRYYADEKDRICLIGINPDRMGAGITPIPGLSSNTAAQQRHPTFNNIWMN
jgi:hypothetical protein